MKTILAAVDFSPITDLVVEQTAQIGKAFGSTVYLLHVAPPEPDFVGYEPGPQHVRDNVAKSIHEHHDVLHQLRDRVASTGVETKVLLIQGPTVEKIVSEAQRVEADLIIIGSHGYGAIRQLILGSVSEGVVKDAPCPVLVVPRSLIEADEEQESAEGIDSPNS